MKRIMLGLFCGLLLLLAACSDDDKGDATLEDAEPTNLETGLMNAISEDAQAFNLELNGDEAKQIHVTVDYYENGTFNDHTIDFSEEIDSTEDEPSTLLFLAKQADDNHIEWTASIISKNGQSSVTSEPIPIKSESSASGPISLPQPLYVDKQKVVTAVTYADGNGEVNSYDIQDRDGINNAIEEDHAFLITLELQN